MTNFCDNVYVVADCGVEMQVSSRKNVTPRKDAQRAFPPEAHGDFPEVKPSEVAEWRERLAAEFGFGSGKWVAQNLLKELKND